MLTLFVIASGREGADFIKTHDSFKGTGVDTKLILVNDWRDINYWNKAEWYGIFWDHEAIDENIREALAEHLMNKRADAIVLYKRIGKREAEFRVRFMRRNVWLTDDYRPLLPWIRFETMLDGWVRDHASPNND